MCFNKSLYFLVGSFPIHVGMYVHIHSFSLTKFIYQDILVYMYLKVLAKSVQIGLCKTTKRKDQLYISLLVSVWRIICENFNQNELILAEI